MYRITYVLLLLALAGGPAYAQRAPDMATLDRGDGISKIAIDTGLTFVDYPYDLALRLELYGQYVTRSGFGIYGALPFTMSFGAPSDDEDPVPPDAIANDAASLSNFELGGLFTATKSRHLSFVFRLGASLPTATDGRDEAVTRYSGVFPRLTDYANTFGEWYVRFGFSPLFYKDHLVFRADLGFDLGIENTVPNLLRFNLGLGYDFGAVAFSLESVNTFAFYEGDDDFLNSLALTVRFMGKRMQPYLAIGAPIDDTSRADIAMFVAGGFQFVP
jgi:hypothetical protein